MKYFIVLWLSVVLLAAPSVFAKRPVHVSYINDGKSFLYSGLPHERGYLFNPDAERRLRLVTLNWPPYIDDSLCNKGWVFQLAVYLLTSQGYGVYVEFLPWARAVRDVELGKADIIFPEYYIEQEAPSDVVRGKTRRALLALSHNFPGGEISLFKHKDSDFQFNGQLQSILDKTIGIVRGYQNTPEFDALIDNGKLKTVEAVNDLQQIKLLTNKRVELIVADPEVVRSTIKQADVSIAEKRHMLNQMHVLTPHLAYNPLYFALSKQVPDWKNILHNLNQALDAKLASGEIQDFIARSKAQCE
ncbi:substrate-binding periplasmic protein [Pseudoalteromonas fenneropenaei]|uniref:Substrate-binding periplasmic protein n=1 Tax=Pseudoalteromonas fenneropenaei TaxID=1737459 RepID=A0ABV7CHU1_9GAMM